MSKLAQAFAKYVIYAKMNANGIVEKPDVIGAIFGQTEGLLGSDMDLRELQRTGRIGRIEVDITSSKGRSSAEIIIPSSMDSADTSLIAATLETIDKVGPCEAQLTVSRVEDVRAQKRNYVIERAKEILKNMIEDESNRHIADSVKESVMTWDITEYKGMPCSRGIENAEEIIIVEGRADVINLLKNGVKNVIAIEGNKVPETIKELANKKSTTAFLDGDRGGDLTLKKLLSIADIDFVTRAENGKEVEELTRKEIYKALRSKTSTVFKKTETHIDEVKMRRFSSLLEDLIGTRAAYLLDSEAQIISKIPISEIIDILNSFSNVYAVVYDGKISQTLIDIAENKRIYCLIGMDRKEDVSVNSIKVLTLKDLKSSGY